jgi:hypothetical protein
MPNISIYLASGNHLEFGMNNIETNRLLKAFEGFVINQKQTDSAFRIDSKNALVIDFNKVELITGEHDVTG